MDKTTPQQKIATKSKTKKKPKEHKKNIENHKIEDKSILDKKEEAKPINHIKEDNSQKEKDKNTIDKKIAITKDNGKDHIQENKEQKDCKNTKIKHRKKSNISKAKSKGKYTELMYHQYRQGKKNIKNNIAYIPAYILIALGASIALIGGSVFPFMGPGLAITGISILMGRAIFDTISTKKSLPPRPPKNFKKTK